MAMLLLERLSSSNTGLVGRWPPSMRRKVRAGSPRGGSILTTSAPQSARIPPAAGPATQTPSSTTFTPRNGPAGDASSSIRLSVWRVDGYPRGGSSTITLDAQAAGPERSEDHLVAT